MHAKICFTILLNAIVASCSTAAAQNKYAVVVGVEKYDLGSTFADLEYTCDDAREMAVMLKYCGYSVRLFSNESKEQLEQAGARDLQPQDPTRDEILEAINEACSRASNGDDLIFFFSGHGESIRSNQNINDPADRSNSRIYPSDCGKDKAKYLLVDEIALNLDKSKASKKLMLIDACRIVPAGLKAAIPTMDADVIPTQGVVTIFSTSEGAFSRELKQFRHAIFTYELMALLKEKKNWSLNKGVSLDTIERHLPSAVSKVKTEQGEFQIPKIKLPQQRVSKGLPVVVFPERKPAQALYQSSMPFSYRNEPNQSQLESFNQSGKVFVDVNFYGMFTGTQFVKAVFRRCHFYDVELNGGASLTGAKFIDCEFHGRTTFESAHEIEKAIVLETYAYESLPWNPKKPPKIFASQLGK